VQQLSFEVPLICRHHLIEQKLSSVRGSVSFHKYFSTFRHIWSEFRSLFSEQPLGSSVWEDLSDFDVLMWTDLRDFQEAIDLSEPLKTALAQATGGAVWEVKIPLELKALFDQWLAVVNFSIVGRQITKTLSEWNFQLTHDSCRFSAEFNPELHKDILQNVMLYQLEYIQRECKHFADECWKFQKQQSPSSDDQEMRNLFSKLNEVRFPSTAKNDESPGQAKLANSLLKQIKQSKKWLIKKPRNPEFPSGELN
jgi:hypothetical protein